MPHRRPGHAVGVFLAPRVAGLESPRFVEGFPVNVLCSWRKLLANRDWQGGIAGVEHDGLDQMGDRSTMPAPAPRCLDLSQ